MFSPGVTVNVCGMVSVHPVPASVTTTVNEYVKATPGVNVTVTEDESALAEVISTSAVDSAQLYVDPADAPLTLKTVCRFGSVAQRVEGADAIAGIG